MLPAIPWIEPTRAEASRAWRVMQRFRRPPRQIATCDLCGEAIMSNESYHQTGCSIVHLRCEWASAKCRYPGPSFIQPSEQVTGR